MKFAQPNQSTFYRGLKTEVTHYFEQSGKSPYANASLWLKGLLFLALFAGSHLAIYSGQLSLAGYALAYVVMSLCAVLIVFNVVHDASHKALSKRGWVNRLGRYLGDLVGINTYIWDIRHNMQHHTFTNVLGGDLIIENIPILRLTPEQPHHPMHRYQAYYAPLLYCLYSAYWILVIDIKLFFLKEICNLKNIRHPRREWLTLIGFKGLYVAYTLVLPWLLTDLSLGQTLACFLIGHTAAGLLLSFVAVLGHFVEGPAFPAPAADGSLPTSWAEHELATTIDFAPRSWLAHALTGGLNTHTAHHLFPRMSHVHYRAVTARIAAYCQQHGYAYQQESFAGAMRSHFRYLHRLGKAA